MPSSQPTLPQLARASLAQSRSSVPQVDPGQDEQLLHDETPGDDDDEEETPEEEDTGDGQDNELHPEPNGDQDEALVFDPEEFDAFRERSPEPPARPQPAERAAIHSKRKATGDHAEAESMVKPGSKKAKTTHSPGTRE